jgi:hypothetical protein
MLHIVTAVDTTNTDPGADLVSPSAPSAEQPPPVAPLLPSYENTKHSDPASSTATPAGEQLAGARARTHDESAAALRREMHNGPSVPVTLTTRAP